MEKTSVETWRPGISSLRCLFCGNTGQHLVRKHRNKVTRWSLGPLLLLGCCPLCIVPFLHLGSNVLNIYCKNCGKYLGTYDRKTERFLPPAKTPRKQKLLALLLQLKH